MSTIKKSPGLVLPTGVIDQNIINSINANIKIYDAEFDAYEGKEYGIEIYRKGLLIVKKFNNDVYTLSNSTTRVSLSDLAISNGTIKLYDTAGVRLDGNNVVFTENTGTTAIKRYVKLYLEEDPDIYLILEVQQDGAKYVCINTVIENTKYDNEIFLKKGAEFKKITVSNSKGSVSIDDQKLPEWLKLVNISTEYIGRECEGELKQYLVGPTNSYYGNASTFDETRTATIVVNGQVEENDGQDFITITQALQDKDAIYIATIKNAITGAIVKNSNYIEVTPSSGTGDTIYLEVCYEKQGDQTKYIVDIVDIGFGNDWLYTDAEKPYSFKVYIKDNLLEDDKYAKERYVIIRITDIETGNVCEMLIKQQVK